MYCDTLQWLGRLFFSALKSSSKSSVLYLKENSLGSYIIVVRSVVDFLNIKQACTNIRDFSTNQLEMIFRIIEASS